MPTLNRTAARRRIQKSVTRWVVPAMLAWTLVGSGTAISAPPAQNLETPPTAPAHAKSAKPGAASVASAKTRADLAGQEQWDVYYLGLARLGYGFTRWRTPPRRLMCLPRLKPRGDCYSP